ncbi:MAG: helix-turn-helix domain-containing protein, partial [Chitinophagaceae bacterium]|nr:helix-turn-helix domain-containing protein [Chitinophagaceae bacterium]
MTALRKKQTPSSGIKTYHFLPRKYGRDLLLDIGRIETLKDFVRDSTPHTISFYEIMFIESGKGVFELDEHRTTLAPRTVIFTSPGQVRRWRAKEVRGYTLFFEKDFLSLFFTDELFLYRLQYFHQYASPTGLKMPAKTFERVFELARSIDNEFNQLQNDSSHLLRAVLYQLLIVLNRYYADTYMVQADTQIHPDFLRFRLLLEKQFASHRQVAAYTRMLGIGATHLNRVCRQYGGLSAQQMIHHKLLSEIKRELRGTRSVKEIAYSFDFSGP